jgi:hypothetical protein
MFDPAWLGIMLAKLACGAGEALAQFVENRSPRAGCSLVNRQNVRGAHGLSRRVSPTNARGWLKNYAKLRRTAKK